MTVKTVCVCTAEHAVEILCKMRMCLCVSNVSVDGVLTVRPSDTTALAGAEVVLRCTTSRSGPPPWIHWIRNPGCTDSALIVYNCKVESGFTSQYSVKSNEAGRCDLVIKAATSDLAEQYICTDNVDTVYAELTVIGE